MERRVLVTYESIPSELWARVEPDLTAQLPLRNLHWKPALRPLRTIQALNLDLKAFQSLADDQNAPKSTSILERPYLHLLFVSCEDQEQYRATLRQQVRQWLDLVLAKRNQEWLIVHVTTGNKGGQAAKFYQRKGSLLDKIKADFNIGKRDRCIQLNQPAFNGPEDPASWAELLTKVKENLIYTFDANVSVYEEETRKIDSQRALPGWNFCTFFIQKEGLALSFEAMNLIEDALIQYDELEAAFFQAMKENKLSWFGNLGARSAAEDTVSLFSTTQKPYRDYIKSNDISLFDFRCYVFARQASLLIKLQRVLELARRGKEFIGSMAAILQEQQPDDSIKKQSWVYSACLELIDRCDQELGSNLPPGYAGVQAESLDMARKQLDQIGMACNHLPCIYPFSASLPDEGPAGSVVQSEVAASQSSSHAVSPALQAAISDIEEMDHLYRRLVDRTSAAYLACGRKRTATRLKASLAALDLHRGRDQKAQQAFASLAIAYSDPDWALIHSRYLKESIELYDKLGMRKEELLSILTLLRLGLSGKQAAWATRMPAQATPTENAAALVQSVIKLASTLDKDFAATAFPAFACRMAAKYTSAPEDNDGMCVRVSVDNLLPCFVPFDEVRLKFIDNHSTNYWFTSSAGVLSPGTQELTVYCSNYTTGRLVLDVSQIKTSKIVFQYSHRPIQGQIEAPAVLRSRTITAAVHVRAARMFIEQSATVALDSQRQAVLSSHTSKHVPNSITLHAAANDGKARFNLAQSSLESENDGLTLSFADSRVHLSGVKPMQDIRIIIPFEAASDTAQIPVVLSAEWPDYANGKPHSMRTYCDLVHVLPLSLNVQDIFRQEKVISKLTVIPNAGMSLRIKSATLTDDNRAFSIKPARATGSPSLLVAPSDQASYLFMSHRTEESEEPKGKLRLNLQFRTLEKEAILLIQERLITALDRRKLGEYASLAQIISTSIYSSLANASHSMKRQQLCFSIHSEETWRHGLQKVFGNSPDIAELAACVKEVTETPIGLATDDNGLVWQELSLLVDPPSVPILNTVDFQMDVSHRVEIGQIIPAVIRIETSSRWNRSSAVPQEQWMTYDTHCDLADWVVVGRKRGDFLIQDEAEELDLVLIPLRSGSLNVPSVSVRPCLQPGRSASDLPTNEVHQLNSAQRVEVVPEQRRTSFWVSLMPPAQGNEIEGFA